MNQAAAAIIQLSTDARVISMLFAWETGNSPMVLRKSRITCSTRINVLRCTTRQSRPRSAAARRSAAPETQRQRNATWRRPSSSTTSRSASVCRHSRRSQGLIGHSVKRTSTSTRGCKIDFDKIAAVHMTLYICLIFLHLNHSICTFPSKSSQL
jgi:hypothetical protein